MIQRGQQLELNFEGFVNEKEQSLFNSMKELRKYFQRPAGVIREKIKDKVKTQKKSFSSVMTKIKNGGDIMGILPSEKTLLKHFQNLETLSSSSNLDLDNYLEAIFLQKFYKFFYKAKNGISPDKKERLLSNGLLIQEVYFLYKLSENGFSDNEFKQIVQIYKFQVEDGNNSAKELAQKYKVSALFRRNIKNIIFIHKLASNNDYDFDFVQSKIFVLLAVSYIKRGNNANSISVNILKALKCLKDNESVDFEKIFEETTKTVRGKIIKISRGNTKIPLDIWLLIKLVIGDTKTNHLQIVKSTLSNNFTQKNLSRINTLGKISEKENKEFNQIFDEIKQKFSKIEDLLK